MKLYRGDVMGILLRITLFLSSYFPLYILLLINEAIVHFNSKKSFIKYFDLIEILFVFLLLLLITISIIGISCFIIDKGNTTLSIPKNYETQGDNVICYLMTYIVPLITVTEINTYTIIQNIFLFVIIGIIYVQQGLIYLNPTLALLNYKFYKTDDNVIVLTKIPIESLESARQNGHQVFGRRYNHKFHVYKEIRWK
ncbi:hypothetical protein ACSN5U_000551 [Staphylococcus pseudintermedius]